MSAAPPIDLRFDLTNRISLEGKHTVAGWLCPAAGSEDQR